jgi:hypothetical protein
MKQKKTQKKGFLIYIVAGIAVAALIAVLVGGPSGLFQPRYLNINVVCEEQTVEEGTTAIVSPGYPVIEMSVPRHPPGFDSFTYVIDPSGNETLVYSLGHLFSYSDNMPIVETIKPKQEGIYTVKFFAVYFVSDSNGDLVKKLLETRTIKITTCR